MSKTIARDLFIKEVNKILGEAYEEVKRIRKIVDKEQQAEEARNAMRDLISKWDNKVLFAYQEHREAGELGTWQDEKLAFFDVTEKKYENLTSPYLLLMRIESETSDKPIQQESKQKTNKSTPPPPPTSQSTSNQTQENNHCAECNKNFTGEYWYHLTKNDNLKFCSQNHFQLFYAPLCNRCLKKSPIHRLDEQQIIWCYPCLKERLNEKENKFQQEKKETLARLKKAEEENKKGWEKTLKEVQENIQKQIEEAQKDDQSELVDNHKTPIITQKDKDMNSNLNMNTAERERERESKSNNSHLIYWTIGIIGVSLITLLGFLIIKKNK